MAERKKGKKKHSRPAISDPSNFVHVQHVGYDREKGLAATNVDERLQALLDTIGMKGVGGKKEKKARDFIRAVMKNGSVEKGKVENHVDGEEAKTDESKAVESKITESKTTESKTTESKTTESATKTAEQEKSEEVASEDTSTPPASPTGASEAPSTSESGDTSSTDTGEAELSLEQQHRVSLIWSLLTCESPAEVLSDDATKRLDELERCLAQKEEELNFLRDESSALTQQVKNLEIENTAVRSHCGTLKQENAALIRQYSNVKMTKDKEPEVMTNSFAIMPQDILMFGKTLGSGNHATVRIGRWCGAPVAVKMFGGVRMSQIDVGICQQELSACCKLSHPNVVSVFGYAAIKDHPLQLAMELMEGSLCDVINAANTSQSYLTQREQLDMAIDCASGLTFLHSIVPSPFAHGSLCSASILITAFLTAKIGDLGTSQIVRQCLGEHKFKSKHTAPENDGGVCVNTVAADVYSMGCTLAHLFMGEELDEEMIEEHLESITDPELNLVCMQMTLANPADRLTAVEALTLLQQKSRDEEYRKCPSKRMASGKLEGLKLVLTKV